MTKIAIIYVFVTRLLPILLLVIICSPVIIPLWLFNKLDDYMTNKADYR